MGRSTSSFSIAMEIAKASNRPMKMGTLRPRLSWSSTNVCPAPPASACSNTPRTFTSFSLRERGTRFSGSPSADSSGRRFSLGSQSPNKSLKSLPTGLLLQSNQRAGHSMQVHYPTFSWLGQRLLLSSSLFYRPF